MWIQRYDGQLTLRNETMFIDDSCFSRTNWRVGWMGIKGDKKRKKVKDEQEEMRGWMGGESKINGGKMYNGSTEREGEVEGKREIYRMCSNSVQCTFSDLLLEPRWSEGAGLFPEEVGGSVTTTISKKPSA
jgi:hypothetical protein